MKYKILTKSKKFYWTINSRIYTILLFTLLPVFIKLNLFKNQNVTFFDKTLFVIGISTILFGFAIRLLRFNKYKTLKGELISELEFLEDKIIIGDKQYLLEDIQKIEINAFDFKGLIIYSKGDLDGNLSNGVDNLLKIYLANQNKIEINFQQIVKNEIRNDQVNLISYCNQNKLHYLNLLQIMGINNYYEIQKFKKEKLINYT